MGRPKGSKNKKWNREYEAGSIATMTPVSNTANAIGQYIRTPSDFDIVLGIRRLKDGQFSGLWELTELDVPMDAEVVRVLVDATAKPSIVRQAWEAIRRTI